LASHRYPAVFPPLGEPDELHGLLTIARKVYLLPIRFIPWWDRN
jgi:hypothetical protein